MSGPEKIHVLIGDGAHNQWTEVPIVNPVPENLSPQTYIRADLVPTWQPIASAPKDGTLIDLWTSNDRIPDCKWDAKRNCFVHWWSGVFDTMDWCRVEYPATHWMPLPKPPSGVA